MAEKKVSVAVAPTSTSLADMVQSHLSGANDLIEKIRTERLEAMAKVEECDQMLTELGQGVPTEPPVANGKKVKPAGASKGTRGGNKYTIYEAVDELTKLTKYKAGLSRADITGNVIGEMGYQTNTDAKDFANSVYTGGINKLVKDKKLYPIGTRPNTVYRNVTHMTKSEIAAAEAALAARGVKD